MKRILGITLSQNQLYFAEWGKDRHWHTHAITYTSKQNAMRELNFTFKKTHEIVLGLPHSACTVQHLTFATQLSKHEISIYLQSKFSGEYFDYHINTTQPSVCLLNVVSVKQAIIEDYLALFQSYKSKIKAIDLNVLALHRFKRWMFATHFKPPKADIYLFTVCGLTLWKKHGY